MKKLQIRHAEKMYAKLLELYPTKFRQQFGEEMKFVFSESLRDAYERDGSKGIFIFLGWTFVDLFMSLFNEHLAERKVHHSMNAIKDANAETSPGTIQKWGGLASFLLAVAFIVSEWVYLTGNLRDAYGSLAYDLADLLYGPVKAVCLVTAVYALRERIGERAPRRTSLALQIAVLSAAMFVIAALFRSTNRHYHIIHPELNLEMSSAVLVVWTTLVGGVIATAWHFMGWTLLLLGSAAWSSGRLPRALSVMYWTVGVLSLFVYLLPEFEGAIVMLGMVMSIWQGILLWKAGPRETPPPKLNASEPELAS